MDVKETKNISYCDSKKKSLGSGSGRGGVKVDVNEELTSLIMQKKVGAASVQGLGVRVDVKEELKLL